MSMNRRQILKAGGALAAATALPDMVSAQATFAPAPGAWRNFQTVTRLQIAKPACQVQAWIPLPAFNADDWFKPAGSTWTTNAKTAEIKRDAKYAAEMLHVVWSADEAAPVVPPLASAVLNVAYAFRSTRPKLSCGRPLVYVPPLSE